MKEETKFSITKLREAIKRLKEGAASAKDELDKDGVVQRFEFTVELLWKTLKIYLEEEGLLCKTPKDCLKAAFRIGLIEDEEVFLNMLEDRNKTSHLYSKQESEEIFERIKNIYINNLEKILAALSKK